MYFSMDLTHRGNEITAPIDLQCFSLNNGNSLDLEPDCNNAITTKLLSATWYVAVFFKQCVVEGLGYGMQFNPVQTAFKI